MPKRGITRFSFKTLLSDSHDKFRRRTLLCFRKFLLSKKIMDMMGAGGREYHGFL